MANPPITIGPFTNVPAPGSPIRSDWPQQITQYVVSSKRGTAVGIAALQSTTWDSSTPAQIASCTFHGEANRRYMLSGAAQIKLDNGSGNLCNLIVTDGGTQLSTYGTQLNVGGGVSYSTIPIAGYLDVSADRPSVALSISVATSFPGSGGFSVLRGVIFVIDSGPLSF